jgi:CheY-like chemotaxis protein
MEHSQLQRIEPEASHVLLVVEDEAMTVRFYVTGMKGLQAQGWRILSAENGARAAELLRQEPVDVVVTDLNMPIMDGYRLITHIYERYPSLPIIVLTSLPPGEAQEKAMRLGALRVMSKPVRLSFLMDEVRQVGELRPEGLVRGLPLSSLLQLMAWEGKTCTLKVRSGRNHGHLYVKNGALIHAQHGGNEGHLAAMDILNWDKPRVEFVETCRVEATINVPLSEILLDAAVMQDTEKAQEDTEMPNLGSDRDDPWSLVDRS